MKNDVSVIVTQSMSLKEITDLLKVRHNDAMRIVDKMVITQEFGLATKISHPIKSGKGRTQNIQTYKLDKRQSIAVAARLNTALLMAVIDRWQELESQTVTPPKTALPPQYVRYLEHTRDVPRGHFCAMQLVYNGFIAKLSYVGHDLLENLLPDGSFSRMFSAKLRKRGINVDSFAGYPFKSPTSNYRGKARAYPMQYYAEADQFLHDFWLPKHAEKYLAGRDQSALGKMPVALPYLGELR